ncbi:hypothetical protein BJF83_11220 [Nocardiopsis sp. CNR-923]|uniref:hypothetical protein n=1 Tax=Nocardiopsis sp. CNR-923 TaxID=1904965 RepID=UPI00095A0669|nr:hypothetical protein [Nocardiopsis sp. CNR-923]OLT29474.1 hypothetical protein BJF83_11220 [Nocardiopsis sp. CNR-923]
MSDYPTDLSGLTGSQLVRVFLDAVHTPPSTDVERAEFFDFKARVFARIAERDGNPDAAKAAVRARADRDRVLARIEAAMGGEV